jgi:hypothetical protein
LPGNFLTSCKKFLLSYILECQVIYFYCKNSKIFFGFCG